MVVIIKIMVFGMTPFCQVAGYQHFREICCLNFIPCRRRQQILLKMSTHFSPMSYQMNVGVNVLSSPMNNMQK
jgi:hypothetical protein